jgi:hypothetical protein
MTQISASVRLEGDSLWFYLSIRLLCQLLLLTWSRVESSSLVASQNYNSSGVLLSHVSSSSDDSDSSDLLFNLLGGLSDFTSS